MEKCLTALCRTFMVAMVALFVSGAAVAVNDDEVCERCGRVKLKGSSHICSACERCGRHTLKGFSHICIVRKKPSKNIKRRETAPQDESADSSKSGNDSRASSGAKAGQGQEAKKNEAVGMGLPQLNKEDLEALRQLRDMSSAMSGGAIPEAMNEPAQQAPRRLGSQISR